MVATAANAFSICTFSRRTGISTRRSSPMDASRMTQLEFAEERDQSTNTACASLRALMIGGSNFSPN
jgi:hypothetical protein